MAWVTVQFDGERQSAPARAAAFDGRPTPCLGDAVLGWSLNGLTQRPGVVVFQAFGKGPVLDGAAAAPGEAPRGLVRGTAPATAPPEGIVYVQPKAREPACVAKYLQQSLQPFPWLSGRYFAKFAVGRDATPSHFQLLTPAPACVTLAIAEAVNACAWEPGTANGKPVTIYMLLPLNFVSK